MKDTVYIKKLKCAVNFKTEQVAFHEKCPPEMVAVDYATIQCDVFETHIEQQTINYRGCNLLHLSTYDAVSFISLAISSGYVKKPDGPKFDGLFYGDTSDGLDTVLRVVVPELRAPGEYAYFRSAQLRSDTRRLPELRAGMHDYIRSRGVRLNPKMIE
ncbi:MAG: hypothetical protein DI498_11450 [Paracoccus denitrificans]|nr:MAG: hypothetical protein DI498_11450 [Paracoccus denitrificans]PZO83477.1 MAG: hypothetical protein DI633_11450 [Paracoccus denitrificans]